MTVSAPAGPAALVVSCGDDQVLLRLADVREILRCPGALPVAGAPPEVLGLAAVRGEILAVLCLHRLLEGEPPACDARFLVVVEGAGVRFGLAVGGVLGTGALADPATWTHAVATDKAGVALAASSGGRPCLVLDVGRVIARIFETDAAREGAAL